VQFTELQAAYELDPWGETRDDLRSAHQTMHLLVPHARPNQVLERSDYLIRFDGEPGASADEHNQQQLHAAASAIRKQRRRRLGRHR
jgi:hypothetical protein